jgi:hypothetical protein
MTTAQQFNLLFLFELLLQTKKLKNRLSVMLITLFWTTSQHMSTICKVGVHQFFAQLWFVQLTIPLQIKAVQITTNFPKII